MKYIIYATGDNGNGYVQKIDEIEELDSFEFRVGLFDKDVVITIEPDYETKNEDNN